jgi:hypothetical protein
MTNENLLSREIMDFAVAAHGLPEGTLGWTAESARQAFYALRGSKVAVIKIEVYDRVVWGFARSEDSWTCNPFPRELASDFGLRSRREAQSWIDGFPRNAVLFAIEFSTQDAAAEATGKVTFEAGDTG